MLESSDAKCYKEILQARKMQHGDNIQFKCLKLIIIVSTFVWLTKTFHTQAPKNALFSLTVSQPNSECTGSWNVYSFPQLCIIAHAWAEPQDAYFSGNNTSGGDLVGVINNYRNKGNID